MSREVSLVFRAGDQVSGPVNTMAGSNDRYNKSLQETARLAQDYRKRQEEIARQIAKTQTAMVGASDEVKKAKKAFAELNDEASRKSLEEAYGRYNKAADGLAELKTAANDTRRAMRDLNDQERKRDEQQRKSAEAQRKIAEEQRKMVEEQRKMAEEQLEVAEEVGGTGGSMLSQLGQAGLTKMVGDALSEVGTAIVGSAFGSDVGTMFSATLSGAVSGAALGSIVPVVGTAVGGALGGAVGAIQGGVQLFQKEDDAFKGYVQEQTQGQLQQRAADIQSGSTIAAGREQDAIAFERMLGEGVGDQYLTDLRAMAAKTPMEYGDLTAMSRKLTAGFKDDPSRMLDLMRSIGDAGSAVGVDASGMESMSAAMSRMQTRGRVDMESLNLIQERGVDAIGMLSEGLGKTKAQVLDLISTGKLGGEEAVQLLQDKMDEWYGGAMAKQSETFAGRASTLADAEKEMQNAYGEGYNEEKGRGIVAQTEWLSGMSGEAQQEANRAMGAYQASLENAKDQYVRDAVDEAMESGAYQEAKAAGDAAEMGRIIAQAKVRGQSEYNANEGRDDLLASELALAEGIRRDTEGNAAFYDAGLMRGRAFSRGLGDGMTDAVNSFLHTPVNELIFGTKPTGLGGDSVRGGGFGGKPNAWGLDRVPYDGFPALLHEGERVLTAREARQQDGGGGGVVIQTGPVTVREEPDIGKIAQELLRQAVRAKLLAAP